MVVSGRRSSLLQNMMVPGSTSKVRRRVLVVFGGGSEQAARQWTDEMERGSFDLVNVCSGADIMRSIPVCEDHDDVLRYDMTLLRSLCDILIIHVSSCGEGDPPDDFGSFFLALMTAATAVTAHDGQYLAGLQHAVLGEGHTQLEGRTFQNVPRLTDKYLGECGSRRFAMRVEVDAALQGGEAQRQVFATSVREALQALPGAAEPAVCAWSDARGCTVAARSDHVTPKTLEALSAHQPTDSEWGDFACVSWSRSSDLSFNPCYPPRLACSLTKSSPGRDRTPQGLGVDRPSASRAAAYAVLLGERDTIACVDCPPVRLDSEASCERHRSKKLAAGAGAHVSGRGCQYWPALLSSRMMAIGNHLHFIAVSAGRSPVCSV